MSDIVERLRELHTDMHLSIGGVASLAADEIERLREQLADAKDDCLRRHRDACDRWEALMDIRLVANEPGDRRALVDKIYGIATKALRPITEASRYTGAVGSPHDPS